MTDKPPSLRRELGTLLVKHGFTGKAPTRTKPLPEVVLIINLQRSEWSHSYYLNLAVGVRARGATEKTKAHQAQVQIRADSDCALPGQASRSGRALTLRFSVPSSTT